jgi:hypothetical protein
VVQPIALFNLVMSETKKQTSGLYYEKGKKYVSQTKLTEYFKPKVNSKRKIDACGSVVDTPTKKKTSGNIGSITSFVLSKNINNSNRCDNNNNNYGDVDDNYYNNNDNEFICGNSCFHKNTRMCTISDVKENMNILTHNHDIFIFENSTRNDAVVIDFLLSLNDSHRNIRCTVLEFKLFHREHTSTKKNHVVCVPTDNELELNTPIVERLCKTERMFCTDTMFFKAQYDEVFRNEMLKNEIIVDEDTNSVMCDESNGSKKSSYEYNIELELRKLKLKISAMSTVTQYIMFGKSAYHDTPALSDSQTKGMFLFLRKKYLNSSNINTKIYFYATESNRWFCVKLDRNSKITWVVCDKNTVSINNIGGYTMLNVSRDADNDMVFKLFN